MRAGAANRNRTNDHEFVEVTDVRKFRERRLLNVAAIKYFVDKHFGNALTGVMRIVVTLSIDHQAFQNSLHLHCDFVN